jgi:hypothetical protein
MVKEHVIAMPRNQRAPGKSLGVRCAETPWTYIT